MDTTEIEVRAESHNLIANDWGTASLILLIVNVVLSAIVSSKLLQIVALPDYVAAILSLLVAINSGTIAALEPSQKAAKHKEAITKYRRAKGIVDEQEMVLELSKIEAESPILRFRTRVRAINRLKQLGRIQ
jgi:hypothetical protein